MQKKLLYNKRIGSIQEENIGVLQRVKSSFSSKQRGQGLVEFALVIPLFFLLMVAIFEFGYFFFVYVSANTAVREAARYGAGLGASVNGPPYYQDCDGIREVAVRIGRYANIQEGNIIISYDTGPTTTVKGTCSGTVGSYVPELGQRIVVHIDVGYRPVFLFGGRREVFTVIQTESARTIIKNVPVGG